MTEQQLIYIRRRRQENISWLSIAKEFEMPWQELRKEWMRWIKKGKVEECLK